MGEEEGKRGARGGARRKTFKVFIKTQTNNSRDGLWREEKDKSDKYYVVLNQMKVE